MAVSDGGFPGYFTMMPSLVMIAIGLSKTTERPAEILYHQE